MNPPMRHPTIAPVPQPTGLNSASNMNGINIVIVSFEITARTKVAQVFRGGARATRYPPGPSDNTAISRIKSGLGSLPRPLPPTTAMSGVPDSRITTITTVRLLPLVVCLAAEVLGIAGAADRPRRAFLPDFGKKIH